mgnify:CR=1 FL=1
MNFFLENPMLSVYLLLKLDAVVAFIVGLAIVTAMGTILIMLMSEEVPKQWKKILATIAVLGVVATIIPSTNQAAVMLGASAGVEVSKQIAASPITEKALKVLEGKIEQALNDLDPKPKK